MRPVSYFSYTEIRLCNAGRMQRREHAATISTNADGHSVAADAKPTSQNYVFELQRVLTQFDWRPDVLMLTQAGSALLLRRMTAPLASTDIGLALRLVVVVFAEPPVLGDQSIAARLALTKDAPPCRNRPDCSAIARHMRQNSSR